MMFHDVLTRIFAITLKDCVATFRRDDSLIFSVMQSYVIAGEKGSLLSADLDREMKCPVNCFIHENASHVKEHYES